MVFVHLVVENNGVILLHSGSKAFKFLFVLFCLLEHVMEIFHYKTAEVAFFITRDFPESELQNKIVSYS